MGLEVSIMKHDLALMDLGLAVRIQRAALDELQGAKAETQLIELCTARLSQLSESVCALLADRHQEQELTRLGQWLLGNFPQEKRNGEGPVDMAIRIMADKGTKEHEEGKIMRRELNEHKINPANDKLTIEVLDAEGAGGAQHHYLIGGFHTATNVSVNQPGGVLADETAVNIVFQNGSIPECGVNGVTQEALLAIVADRLRSFQKGAYACKANACALTHIEEAQHWLQQRTIERMRRGVEGTHTV